VVFSLDGERGAEQYLKASLEYLNERRRYRRMRFEFPNVRERCLLCGNAGCSRWKGYYVRFVICAAWKYAGPIAIHLAQCRTRGVDYTYWPEVLIPYRRPSVPTLRLFYQTWVARNFSIRQAIDEVVGAIDSEIFIPVSVAFVWLTYVLKGLLLNHAELSVRAPESIMTSALRGYQPATIVELFHGARLWRPGPQTIRAPP
jgi:hypothetical protein